MLVASQGSSERDKQALRVRNALGAFLGEAEHEIGSSYEATMWGGGSASAQHNPHTEHYSKLPVYFTSVLYIPLLVHLSPDFVLPISLH